MRNLALPYPTSSLSHFFQTNCIRIPLFARDIAHACLRIITFPWIFAAVVAIRTDGYYHWVKHRPEPIIDISKATVSIGNVSISAVVPFNWDHRHLLQFWHIQISLLSFRLTAEIYE